MPSCEGGAGGGGGASQINRDRALLARHVYDLTVIGHSETETELSLEMERCWPAVNSTAVPLSLRLEGCCRARDLMYESYKQRGSKPELDWAIRFSRVATSEEFNAIANPHERVENFYGLCHMLLSMFNLDGSAEALQESIMWGREGRNLACSENISELRLPLSLGNGFIARFQLTRNADDLEEAILLDRQGVTHSGTDSMERWQYQANLTTRLLMREPYVEHIQSRREALDIISVLLYHLPRGHALQDTVLQNLALIIGSTTEEEGFWTDSERPLYLCQRALQTTVPQNAYRAGILTNMAAILGKRFEATAETEFIQEAVGCSKNANKLVYDQHPWRTVVQRRYAENLKLRFETTRCVADLEEALAEIRNLTEGTPVDDLNRALYFRFLLCLTVRRFIKFGLPRDLLSICDAMRIFHRQNDLHPSSPNYRLRINEMIIVPLNFVLHSSENIPQPEVVPLNPRLYTGEGEANNEVWRVMVGAWYAALQSELGALFNEDAIFPSIARCFNGQFNLELVFERRLGNAVRRIGQGLLRRLPGAVTFSFRFEDWLNLCDRSLRSMPVENVDFLVRRGRAYYRDREDFVRLLLAFSRRARRRGTSSWYRKAQDLTELAVASLSPNLTTGVFSTSAGVQITGLERSSLRTEALGITSGILRRLYTRSNSDEYLELAKRYAEVAWIESGGTQESVAFVYGLVLKDKHLRTGDDSYLEQAIERVDDAIKIIQRQARAPSSDMLYELGILFRWSYMAFLNLDSLNKSISKLRQALEVSVFGEQRSLVSSALAVSLVFRGRRFRSITDLDEAVRRCQDIFEDPRGADMIGLHYTAANIYSVRAGLFPRNDLFLRARRDDFQMAAYHMRHADRLDVDKDPSRLVDFAVILLSKYDTSRDTQDAINALSYVHDALQIYEKTHMGRVVALRVLICILSLPVIGLRVDPLKSHIVSCLQEALDSSDSSVVTRVKAGEFLSQYQSLDGKHLEYFETLKKMLTLLADNFSRLSETDRHELAEIIEDLPSDIAAVAFRMGVSQAGVVYLENRVKDVLSLNPSSGSQRIGEPIMTAFADVEL